MKAVIKAFIPAREHSIGKLFELKEKLGFDGLDLLYQLLELDPQRRISAEAALHHKFFDSVRATQ